MFAIRTLDNACFWEGSEVCVGGTNELGLGKKGASEDVVIMCLKVE